MKRLDGKVALISGTARGAGRRYVSRPRARSWSAATCDEGAVETQRLIARAGSTALTTGPLDVTDDGSVRTRAEEAADAFGGFLASGEAAHITGTHLVVDGGCPTVLPGAAH